MGQRLTRWVSPPTTIMELRHYVQKEMKNVSQYVIRYLYNPKHTWVQACVKDQGL